MKKLPSALLTCKGMLPPEVIKKLEAELDLRYGSCGMSEEELLVALQGEEFNLWGC